MRAMILAAAAPLAAFAFSASPAAAQGLAGSPPSTAAAPAADGGFVASHRGGHGPRHHHRQHRRFPGTFIVVAPGAFGWPAPEGWALYNNRSWESDSYNDWWHDQPWRSYPRWVQDNRTGRAARPSVSGGAAAAGGAKWKEVPSRSKSVTSIDTAWGRSSAGSRAPGPPCPRHGGMRLLYALAPDCWRNRSPALGGSS